ncbi:Hypothetical predicted protein [Paramuricea clavata]|uniref:Uncharacterized protein n=1 Tax=Paramuricea clavata TaxID=317549 RepID=A0A7D9L1Z9_PARCT|nr:Hypothetical predicted protein [Paramuricea clavata]
MAKQQQQEPNYPMTMRKREISPEETTDRTSHLQDSKTLATLSTRRGKIRERTDNVIKNISCSETKGGTMDGRRRSAGILQNIGVVQSRSKIPSGTLSPKSTKESTRKACMLARISYTSQHDNTYRRFSKAAVVEIR